MKKSLFLSLLFWGACAIANGLPDVITTSPEATYRTFYSAMSDYTKGVESKNDSLKMRIDDAIYCLDLRKFSSDDQHYEGRKVAIYLKEILDRIVKPSNVHFPEKIDKRWQLNNKLIIIQEVFEGERKGEFLFSPATVANAKRLYKRIKDEPYLVEQFPGTGYEKGRKTLVGKFDLSIKTGTPKETVQTFYTAMQDYRQGVDLKDEALKVRIYDAIACLEKPVGFSEQQMMNAAIFMKEVIDRTLIVNYELIRDSTDTQEQRLGRTGFRIHKITEGGQAGEFLFAASTVKNSKRIYQKVKDEPYLSSEFQGAEYEPPIIQTAIPKWAQKTDLILPNWQWIGLFIILLLGMIGRVVVKWFLKLLLKITEKTKAEWDDNLVFEVESPLSLFFATIIWYAGLKIIHIDELSFANTILFGIVKIIMSISVIWLFYKLADIVSDYFETVASKSENTLDDHLAPLVKRSLRVFTVIFGILITCQNMGINVMSILAGLGLGGLAFALAAKDTCSNFFGSIMILSDQPFKIGDWVIVGNLEGTVEGIGFRSTRIRTFYNSEVVIPNAMIANANIDNMGRRNYRRIKAFFGVKYDTPPEKMEAFIEGIKNIVKANPYTRKDYFHVVFNSYQDSALEVMLYCFLKVPDWSEELVQRQNIYMEVLRLAKSMDVEFAYPTQSLHIENFPEKAPLFPQPEFKRDDIEAVAAAYGPNGSMAKPGGLGIFQPPHKSCGIKGEAGE